MGRGLAPVAATPVAARMRMQGSVPCCRAFPPHPLAIDHELFDLVGVQRQAKANPEHLEVL